MTLVIFTMRVVFSYRKYGLKIVKNKIVIVLEIEVSVVASSGFISASLRRTAVFEMLSHFPDIGLNSYKSIFPLLVSISLLISGLYEGWNEKK